MTVPLNAPSIHQGRKRCVDRSTYVKWKQGAPGMVDYDIALRGTDNKRRKAPRKATPWSGWKQGQV
jgi:hypothetical protein